MNKKSILLFSLITITTFPMLAMQYGQALLDSNLQGAAHFGRAQRAKDLLMQGANPNSLTKAGLSPLMMSAMYAYVKTCEVLLEHDADLNQQSEDEYLLGATPLMFVINHLGDNASKSRIEICKMFINQNPNLALANARGDTALTIAAQKEDEFICRELLNCESSKIKPSRIKALLLCLRQLGTDNKPHAAIKAGSILLYKHANFLLRQHFQGVYCKPLHLLQMKNNKGLTAYDYLPVHFLKLDDEVQNEK